MEMSHAYMQQTAAHMKGFGWHLESKSDETKLGGGVVDALGNPACATTHAYQMSMPDGPKLVMETVITMTPDGEEHVRYFFEICEYFGLTCDSYELDSWKHFPDRVEFKYKCDSETSLAPSVIIGLNQS